MSDIGGQLEPLAQDISDLGGAGSGLRLAQGVITAVVGTLPGQQVNVVSAQFDGSARSVPARYLGAVPRIGDTAWCLVSNSDRLMLGALGTIGPAGVARCRVRKTTAANPATYSSATVTTVNWETEDYDLGSSGIWSIGTPSRLIAPCDGIWHIDHAWRWAQSTSNGRRVSLLNRSGVVIAEDEVPTTVDAGGAYVSNRHSLDLPMTAGQYVEIQVYQDSGGDLANRTDLAHGCYFSMHYVGPLT